MALCLPEKEAVGDIHSIRKSQCRKSGYWFSSTGGMSLGDFYGLYRTRNPKILFRVFFKNPQKSICSRTAERNFFTSCFNYYRISIHEPMKTITLRDDTYHALLSLKEDDDSFSDVIDRLVTRKNRDIREYAGGLRGSKVLDDLQSFSKKMRSSGKARV